MRPAQIHRRDRVSPPPVWPRLPDAGPLCRAQRPRPSSMHPHRSRKRWLRSPSPRLPAAPPSRSSAPMRSSLTSLRSAVRVHSRRTRQPSKCSRTIARRFCAGKERSPSSRPPLARRRGAPSAASSPEGYSRAVREDDSFSCSGSGRTGLPCSPRCSRSAAFC